MQIAAIVAITTGTGLAVYTERATVVSGLRTLTHANFGWVVAGFIAESLSMTAFALLQRRLLLPTEARLTFGSLMAIVYTSTAISLAVPVVGSGLATAYSHRRFRTSGADHRAARGQAPGPRRRRGRPVLPHHHVQDRDDAAVDGIPVPTRAPAPGTLAETLGRPGIAGATRR